MGILLRLGGEHHMESKDTIVKNALDQLIIRALYDLEQSDAAINEASSRLSALHDALRFDDKLEPIVQERIRQYIEETAKVVTNEFRYIYLQGAKDSVIVMRELGAIKS